MKKFLLATTAATAFIAMPAMAQNGHDGPSLDADVNVDLTYENEIKTRLETDATFVKLVGIFGDVTLDGSIAVDSSAVAITDAKQLQQGVAATYREENELNGENG